MLTQIPLSQGTSGGLCYPRLRPSRSMQCMPSGPIVGVRNPSISVAFSHLTLEDGPHGHDRYQVMSTVMGPPLARPRKMLSTLSLSEQSVVKDPLQSSKASLASPRTPSQIPTRSKRNEDRDVFETPTKKLRRSPSKASFSPFLNKDSNVQNFTAWNVTERIDKMESMYSSLKDTLESSVSERSILEQEQSLVKAKGMPTQSLS